MKEQYHLIAGMLLVILSMSLDARASIPMAANPLSAQSVALWRPISLLIQKSNRLLEQNDLRGAQQAVDEALRLAGGRRGATMYEIAPVYLQTGQYGKAAALFDANPYHGMSLSAAIAYTKVGRLADARRCYSDSQMLSMHREFKPYLINTASPKAFEANLFLWRGILDVDQNRPASALWALKRAIQTVPENPLALWYYAEALANSGLPRLARPFFKAAIARDNGRAAQGARAGLARLGVQTGR